jgi:hypothetical protein
MLPKRMMLPLLAGTMLAMPGMAAAETPDTHPQSDPADLHFVPAITPADLPTALSPERLAIFAPTADPIRHTIDYEIWDYALKQFVMAMGPSDRQSAPRADPVTGTRVQQGPQSRFRLEGSVVMYNFLTPDAIASFTEYRKDLEGVTNTLDIASLPRNEQLAFWINLHNVALLEQLAKNWPLREPRQVMLGGVPLDEARFITIRGIPASLRDIREEIVFRHWRDPKVIYGFWRGDIGGPELQRFAFTGDNVAGLLDVAAQDYVNSLRAVQQRGNTLAVASLYTEVAPFYFRDFESDLRAHLGKYADEPVRELLAETRIVDPSLRETRLADLHGGARPANYLFDDSLAGGPGVDLIGWSTRLGPGAGGLVAARARKLHVMMLRGQPTGRVFMTNVQQPDDHPNTNAVE